MGDNKGNNLEETGRKIQQAGKKIEKVGCALTLLFTLPIVGLMIFGVVGLIVGGVIGLLGFAGMFANKDK